MQSQCKHCKNYFDKKDIANHSKWCLENPNRGKSKFLTYVNCPECGVETTKQSLKAHLQMHINAKIAKCKCLHCGDDIFETRKKFCDHSCAAAYNNTKRICKSGPSKGTYRIYGPPKTLFNNTRPHIFERTAICASCKNTFTYTTRTAWLSKYCSDDCRMESVKYNRGRHKRSYMEISFSEWLNNHQIGHQTEVHFRNTLLNKSYFADFVFEELKLIIELDGSQHEQTVEQDDIRDQYLTSLGYTVLRINHKDYQAQTYMPELMKIFGIK